MEKIESWAEKITGQNKYLMNLVMEQGEVFQLNFKW